VGYTNTSTRGGPDFNGTPQTVADLNRLRDYVEEFGNISKGSTLARNAVTGAAKYTGRLWFDVDLGILFVCVGTTWVPLIRTTATGRRKQVKRGSDGTASMTAFTGLVPGATWTAAPAGEYLIGAVVSVSGSAATDGNVRLQVGPAGSAVNITDDVRADLPVANSAILATPAAPFTWTGGDLLLNVQYRASAGIVTVYGPTNVWAIYLGP